MYLIFIFYFCKDFVCVKIMSYRLNKITLSHAYTLSELCMYFVTLNIRYKCCKLN